MFPSSCDTFVALPPSTVGQRIVFGKNSDRPCDEVQEVVYFPAADHGAGEMVECTYVKVEQAPHTYAVVLSRPAWLWGAEMGANEHQVCIGNEAVWGREDASDEEALLGMDLVRLGLERVDTAQKAVDVIVELLEKYGQGGNCMEDQSIFTYNNSFLISDRTEAWVLETSGKHWAAERVEEGCRNISNQYSITTRIDREHPEMREYAKSQGWWDGKAQFNFAAVYSYMNTARIDASGSRYCEGRKLMEKSKGHITAETMMEILRDKESGINMEGMFMSMGSMVSVVPRDPFPAWSALLHRNPGPREVNDPVKKKPRFQSKPDRKHPLFLKHEVVAAIIETTKERGSKITQNMRQLEKEKMADMEKYLTSGIADSTLIVHLFSDTIEEELKVYSKS
ncbi:hypothetical protein AGOR_G00069480 [Albula goreensis]|uniref:Secernin-3 n=1 Tax=Albula goreensis TaxID=1534307 RepID=A0A8T3DL01_9TELE|nr:hypothetical protein AGOR_G00069480 [Albula goreensis]